MPDDFPDQEPLYRRASSICERRCVQTSGSQSLETIVTKSPPEIITGYRIRGGGDQVNGQVRYPGDCAMANELYHALGGSMQLDRGVQSANLHRLFNA